MKIDTKYRTQETEIMDDFSLQGEELRNTLDQIAGINRMLGGNSIIIKGLRKLLKDADISKPIKIADIGCGSGDMLRMLAKYGRDKNITFRLTGIDANLYTINYAKTLSKDYPEIAYICTDIFNAEAPDFDYDIILCTLTLHHFSDQQIMNIMPALTRSAKIGVIINDLHRSKTAYRLFKIISFVFNLNQMSREDGLISILRGFKKSELEHFSKKLNLSHYTIKWKWAFRYQWIITKK
ncbi:methyltransferase domain-containing protein [Flavobacterium hungaricum]|uniref:Methyltransferase domain-containing protein n=1 Tax=Flavobacterium hungaricum TaxID=2082725 RepID=A0ABR9TKT4_9FLAO|nr:methyltransferase domain-containing protein [Flavobacterium hungaricum]MBE8725968.1 methyltransferase domain-containing protein [Flavobacterium hungaricum]